MELILTSLGASHLPPDRLENADSFYRMPPLTMSTTCNDLVFDYSTLLIFDRVILDTESWDRMCTDTGYHGYDGMREIVKSLYDAGFVRVVDFDSIIRSKRDLLTKMLYQDMKRLDSWVEPLQDSFAAWHRFASSMGDAFRQPTESNLSPPSSPIAHHMFAYGHHFGYHASIVLNHRYLLEEALSSSRKRRRKEYRDVLRVALAEYLSYINANLVLSLEIGAPFHDWADMEPFYKHKLLTVGRQDVPQGQRIRAIRELFQVSFPEFAFWDAKSILGILKDPRLVQLRELIEKSVKGEVAFDDEFAKRTLREALGIEQRIGRVRRITSYATVPFGALPWIGSAVQKGLEELVGIAAERKLRKELGWFYLITDMASRRSHAPRGDSRGTGGTQQRLPADSEDAAAEG